MIRHLLIISYILLLQIPNILLSTSTTTIADNDDGNNIIITANINKETPQCLQSYNITPNDYENYNALILALQLTHPPPPTLTINGEFENDDYWKTHGALLRTAWSQFQNILLQQQRHSQPLPISPYHHLTLSHTLHPPLYHTLRNAHQQPSLSSESTLLSLFTPISPSLYSTTLFTPSAILTLRSLLRQISTLSLPTRRPNGMNRHGFIFDSRVDGAVHIPVLTAFIETLVEDVVRPVGRALFPSWIGRGDDEEMLAFTVRYRVGEDVRLREHRDASVVTFNVNLDDESRMEEEEEGDAADLYFVEEGQRVNMSFVPGMGVIHRGGLRHGTARDVGGRVTKERCQLIIWLFGKGGDVRVAEYEEGDRMGLRERWGEGRYTRKDEKVAIFS